MGRGFEQKWNTTDYLHMHRGRLRELTQAVDIMLADGSQTCAAEFCADQDGDMPGALAVYRGGCSIENVQRVFARHGVTDVDAQLATVSLINNQIRAAAWRQVTTAWYHARHALAMPDDAAFTSGEIVSLETEGLQDDYAVAAVRFSRLPELGDLDVYGITRMADTGISDVYVMVADEQLLAVAATDNALPSAGALQEMIHDFRGQYS